jgi:hypothetical protein
VGDGLGRLRYNSQINSRSQVLRSSDAIKTKHTESGKEGARRFFQNALAAPGHPRPRVIRTGVRFAMTVPSLHRNSNILSNFDQTKKSYLVTLST